MTEREKRRENLWRGVHFSRWMKHVLKAGETVCFSNIFLEESPLNSSIMPWKCDKRETFPGKIRNNSVAENFSSCASQMKQFARLSSRSSSRKDIRTRPKCKVTKLTKVLSLGLYWKCFYFLHEIFSVLRSGSGLIFFLFFSSFSSFCYTFKLSLYH